MKGVEKNSEAAVHRLCDEQKNGFITAERKENGQIKTASPFFNSYYLDFTINMKEK